MVAKITISLPEKLLEVLDAEARELGESRSHLIQEATADYLGKTIAQRERERKRADVQRALEIAAQLRGQPVGDTRPTIDILREIREVGGGASSG
jgi:Arc/MetJ-type ribon-helix-helix transcriptional regulator